MEARRTGRGMGPQEWGLLLLLSVLWGGSFFFSKVALAELPPFTLVLGRVGIAAVALHAALALGGQRAPEGAGLWGRFAVMGAINNLIPLAHAFTRDERLTPRRLAGVLVGFAGVVALLGPELLGGLGAQGLARRGGGRRLLRVRGDTRPTAWSPWQCSRWACSAEPAYYRRAGGGLRRSR